MQDLKSLPVRAGKSTRLILISWVDFRPYRGSAEASTAQLAS
jgi:hypothetical protein